MSVPHITKDSECAVIGYGSWATAIVKILLENGNRVNWFVRNPDVKYHLRTHRTNPKYLSQVHFFTDKLTVTGDIGAAVQPSQVVIFAAPSAFLGVMLEELDPALLAPEKGKFLISAVKGIIPDGFLTVAEWLNQKYKVPFGHIGILTGPCHAEEVALERLSYLTMVCEDETTAECLSDKFRNDYIRVTTSDDIYGAEYAAVLKNIYAIAVGIVHGLGYGDNFQSVLISNSALEMERFLNETSDTSRNICNSAYLGDLLVTCYSQFSRNRTFGVMIGKGYSVRNAQMEMNMVAEGYYGADCIYRLNEKSEVELPIAEAVYRILYQRGNPAREFERILNQLK